jgi:hypothetical protein
MYIFKKSLGKKAFFQKKFVEIQKQGSKNKKGNIKSLPIHLYSL